MFNERIKCDWLVFVFLEKSGSIRSWIVPFDRAIENANKPSKDRKDPHLRYISWAKLQREPLCSFENNWKLFARGVSQPVAIH